jgi:hypothetical protein
MINVVEGTNLEHEPTAEIDTANFLGAVGEARAHSCKDRGNSRKAKHNGDDSTEGSHEGETREGNGMLNTPRPSFYSASNVLIVIIV